jgi:hypothetical protein
MGKTHRMTYHRPDMVVRIALLATALIVAGCSSAAAPSVVAPSPTSAVGASPIVPENAISPVPSDVPASIVEAVVADIAKTAGVAADQVEVVSAEPVTFPDGSLGCPQPGLAYTQMVVEGFKIVAKVGETVYDYRGSGTSFRRCTTDAS